MHSHEAAATSIVKCNGLVVDGSVMKVWWSRDSTTLASLLPMSAAPTAPTPTYMGANSSYTQPSVSSNMQSYYNYYNTQNPQLQQQYNAYAQYYQMYNANPSSYSAYSYPQQSSNQADNNNQQNASDSQHPKS